MHRNIKAFSYEGMINDDSDFIRLRDQFEMIIKQDMRDKGYIPVLDLGPYFSTSLTEDQNYDFMLTVHGVYVGKAKSWEYEGWMNGKLLKKDTVNRK